MNKIDENREELELGSRSLGRNSYSGYPEYTATSNVTAISENGSISYRLPNMMCFLPESSDPLWRYYMGLRPWWGQSSGKAAVKLKKTYLPCGGHVPQTSLAVASNSPWHPKAKQFSSSYSSNLFSSQQASRSYSKKRAPLKLHRHLQSSRNRNFGVFKRVACFMNLWASAINFYSRDPAVGVSG